MNKDKLKLYFIALVPDEPVYSEVMVLKTEFKDRFSIRAALRSPPHITLHMPFQWQEEKEAQLIASLNALKSSSNQIEVELNGFGAFPPRVIFIKVVENDQLNMLQGSIQKMARSAWHIYPKSNNARPFKPHMTIAFRDLKKPQFIEAWSTFAQRTYKATISVTDISLLKHNSKSWDILHRVILE